MGGLTRYRIEASLGRGGMGEVHRAFDTLLRRPVAIKILHTEEADGSAAEAARRSILREARLGAALRHPNVITIHDVVEDDGKAFIVMELLEGKTLSSHLRGQPIDLTTRLGWLHDIAAALYDAHRTGLVHRDIKPENVFVTRRGTVKVLDFGIAKRHGPLPLSAASDFGTPQIAGTPAYMAPEQWIGDADARSDQYAWGILAHELLSGDKPPRWNPAGERPAFRSLAECGVSEQVAAIVERAISVDRDARYSSMKPILEGWPVAPGRTQTSDQWKAADDADTAPSPSIDAFASTRTSATTLGGTAKPENDAAAGETTKVDGSGALPASSRRSSSIPEVVDSGPTLASPDATTKPPSIDPKPAARRRSRAPFYAAGVLLLLGGFALFPIMRGKPSRDLARIQGDDAEVRAGGAKSCVVMVDRSVRCWGDGDPKPRRIEATERSFSLAVGGTHACVIVGADEHATRGEVRCWGANDFGQLGDGTTSPHLDAKAVVLPRPVGIVAAGKTHTCATTDRTDPPIETYCWGDNRMGQLGDGTTLPRLTPVKLDLGGGAHVARLGAGADFTCAIVKPGDETRCWGRNDAGQTGQPPSEEPVLRPTAVPGIPILNGLFLGARFVCAREATTRMPWCWGANDHGQVGIGRMSPSEPPTQVPGLGGVDTVRVGAEHACALLLAPAGPRGRCWGKNDRGQLGVEGPDRPSAVTSPAVDGSMFDSKVSDHMCKVDRTGAVFCWGSNDRGQLGRVGPAFDMTPREVAF